MGPAKIEEPVQQQLQQPPITRKESLTAVKNHYTMTAAIEDTVAPLNIFNSTHSGAMVEEIHECLQLMEHCKHFCEAVWF